MTALAFLEARLDTKVTRGSEPKVMVPGRTHRYTPGRGLTGQNFTASMPKHEFDISHGVRSREDFHVVLDAWMIVNFTPYSGLRVKYWSDFIATATNTTATNISGTIWQLQRKHVFGGVTFKRDIKKPCALPAVVVYNAGGTPLTGTVDTTLGTFTGAGTPAYWTGEFDLPMTFKDSEWTSSLEVSTENLHLMSGTITMIEIPL